jgi:hypothetical protein
MASIGFYPGYAGATVAGGTFVVTQKDATTLTVSYSLTGLTGISGGLHIHSGTSCKDTGSVGGHFWKSVAADPWTTEWKVDATGKAIGAFDVACGYTVDEVLSHTVVVHQGTDKVGCGVLQSSSTPINAGTTPSPTRSSFTVSFASRSVEPSFIACLLLASLFESL